MADSKISALSAVTSLAGTEEFVAAVSGVSNKITAANFAKSMPGYEIGYDEITSNVTVTSTTESSSTTVISCAAHVFDGGPVIAHFFSPVVSIAATAGVFCAVSLFESATQISEFATLEQSSSASTLQVPFSGFIRFTPSAASHTFTISAFKNNAATVLVQAGAGGIGANPPAFVRFTKV